MNIENLHNLVFKLNYYFVVGILLKIIFRFTEVVVKVYDGECWVWKHDTEPTRHFAIVKVKNVRVLFVVLLLVRCQLVNHSHVFVVEFNDGRALVQGHVILGICRVIEFLNACIMQQIILLFKLLKSYLKLGILLFFLEIQDLTDHILKEVLIWNGFWLFSQNLIEHILRSDKVKRPFLKWKFHNGYHHE